MKILKNIIIIILLAYSGIAWAKNYEVNSPNNVLKAIIEVKPEGTFLSVTGKGEQLITPSPISVSVKEGETIKTWWGSGTKVQKIKKDKKDERREVKFFKRNIIHDCYNEITLFNEDSRLIVRAYNDGIAYRFILPSSECIVMNEQADFHFAADWPTYIPYANAGKSGDFSSQYFNSFEKYYTYKNLSEHDPGMLGFLPVMLNGGNWKICITESELINYPGMFLAGNGKDPVLSAHFAPLPTETEPGPYNLDLVVKGRENYIARNPQQKLPWRIMGISHNDADFAVSDLVYRLSTPSKIEDVSWIKPGKVAWDWWNCWNLEKVDFKTGINNETYKYYIDFASKNGIEYVILDEGWSVYKQADLMQVVPEINLEELISYANERNVGLILWAGSWPFYRDMEKVVKHYSQMGIKGFKIDFFSRDDQDMVRFINEAAETCARYHMLVDFHGIYKPTGLNMTWPNVLNYEGVNGLEQMKWSGNEQHVQYDVEIPFIRQFAGPMDYTQGAMTNAARGCFSINYYQPMSFGTRCHQLGMYVVYDSPLNMLCDSPSKYMKEQECVNFISAIPTIWDETIGVDGKIGEYVCIARRSGDTWYLGALTNWEQRDLNIDLSFLEDGDYNIEIFCDGVNADRVGTDYRKEEISLSSNQKLKVTLSPGGGCAAIIHKK